MIDTQRFIKFFIVLLGIYMLFICPVIAELKPVIVDELMSIKASDEAHGNSAQNAMDDNMDTRWETTHGDEPAWLKIILKKEYKIAKIQIIWEKASARKYDIQVSKEGSDWENVASINDGTENDDRIIKFNPVKTKYIRIYCRERATQWGYSIWEIIFNPLEEPEERLPDIDVDNLPFMNPDLPIEKRVDDLLKHMSLKEKIYELSGKDAMDGKSNTRLGIPPLLLADGPHGIRMFGTATCFPSLIASAGWDEDLMRRVGAAIAKEARAKGRNLVLGPCINIHRTPLGGRNFESFSEDPFLVGKMAVAWINGVQSEKIGTSVKHFACNNQEWERGSISVEISERALREIYLPGFKASVCEANATSIMGAYNKVNGDYCCENKHLLIDILKNEWGFKGFVVSDWGAIHDTIKAANAGSDLEMPGPGNFFTRVKILSAVRKGKISESVINDKVKRILYVKFYLGLFDGVEKKYKGAANTKEHQELVMEAAENGIVLLKNKDKILPLNIKKIKSIAVIGPNAKRATLDGGGSSEVIPPYSVGPLEGIQNKCKGRVKVKINYAKGCNVPLHTIFDWTELIVKGKAPRGVEKVIVKCLSENMASGKGLSYVWFDKGSLEIASLESKEILKNPSFEKGTENWKKSGNTKHIGSHDWHFFDGRLSCGIGNDSGPENASGEILQNIRFTDRIKESDIFTFKILAGCEANYTGQASLRLEFLDSKNKLLTSYKSETLSREMDIIDDEILLKEAVKVAKKSDVAIVFAGFYKYFEGEGVDKKNLLLPEGQDELIEAVSKANKNTIVVLINGTPVNMKGWVDKAPGIIEAFYMGQEGGNAIANILFGDVNPSGKLPITFPKKLEDDPSYKNYPGSAGKVYYAEDVFVGYRYYDTKNVEPLFPFGHGLSYTEFKYSNLKINPGSMKKGKIITVDLDIENIGKLDGKEVIQLYIRDIKSSIERPFKELKGFKKINLKSGEKKNIQFELKEDALSFYNPSKKSWIAEPGEFEILIGSSSRDIRLTGRFRFKK